MGRRLQMSWEGEPNFRWVKMYRGTRYRVTCDQLEMPRSKQDSYLAANQWWQRKKAELDKKKYEEETERTIRRLDRKIAYASAHATDLLPPLRREMARVVATAPCDLGASAEEQATIESNIQVAELFGIRCPPGVPNEVLQHFFGDARLWQERFLRSRLVEKQNTLGTCLDEFLAEVRMSQEPATFAELKGYLDWLVSDSGLWTRLTDVGSISEQTVSDHYKLLKGCNYKSGPFNKRLGFFRRFVKWLWIRHKLPNEPRNLYDKSHRAKFVHTEVQRYTGVWKAVMALAPKYRLWALLGLNCGMHNADLGALEWTMINESAWTLTRRRVKTGDNTKVPTVTYKLWPETVALLKRLGRSGSRVFSTKTGKPMYESRYEGEGETRNKDLFALNWKRQRPAPQVPLGKFRSIAATALKTDAVYAQFVDYFLGHAPSSVAERHYAGECDEPFFKATNFVRRHLKAEASSASNGKGRTKK